LLDTSIVSLIDTIVLRSWDTVHFREHRGELLPRLVEDSLRSGRQGLETGRLDSSLRSESQGCLFVEAIGTTEVVPFPVVCGLERWWR